MTDRPEPDHGQPSDHGPPLCGMVRKGRTPCRHPAGWGTDHVGIGYCKFHLGTTASHRAAAATVIAEAKRQELTDRLVDRLGSAPLISTGDAMQVTLDAMAETLAWFRDDVLPVVGAIDETGRATPMLDAMLRQVVEMRDTARYALTAGVEERRVAVAEGQLLVVHRAVAALLAAHGLDVGEQGVAAELAGYLRALDVTSSPVAR